MRSKLSICISCIRKPENLLFWEVYEHFLDFHTTDIVTHDIYPISTTRRLLEYSTFACVCKCRCHIDNDRVRRKKDNVHKLKSIFLHTEMSLCILNHLIGINCKKYEKSGTTLHSVLAMHSHSGIVGVKIFLGL